MVEEMLKRGVDRNLLLMVSFFFLIASGAVILNVYGCCEAGGVLEKNNTIQKGQAAPIFGISGNITPARVEPIRGFSSTDNFILREDSIYYNKEVRKNNYDIFRYNLENSTTEEVLSRPECLQIADVSDKYVVFTADTYYGSNVGVYNMDSGEGRLLVRERLERDYGLNQTFPAVWKDRAAYLEERGNKSYIRFHNLETGENVRIDPKSENAGPLELYEDALIWSGLKSSDNSSISDFRIYLYNLSSRHLESIGKVASRSGPYSVSDDYIVWKGREEGEKMYLYDLEEGEREGAIGLDLPSNVTILAHRMRNNSFVVGFETRGYTWIKRKNIDTGITEKVKMDKNISLVDLKIYQNTTIIRTIDDVYKYDWNFKSA